MAALLASDDTFDPAKAARLHEQLNDALYVRPAGADEDWYGRATWHDQRETVVNFDGLLFDGWSPTNDPRERRLGGKGLLRRA
jgi:hypothetical protein